jgi:hypothetical protein
LNARESKQATYVSGETQGRAYYLFKRLYDLWKNRDKPMEVGQVNLRVARVLMALCFILLPMDSQAGIRDILDAIQTSEFRFMRSESDVPFYPVGWVQNTFYPSNGFQDKDGVFPDGEAAEDTFNIGLLMPVYVAKRDMLVLGADLAWDLLQVRDGPYQDQSVVRLAPVAGWLHQFGESDTLIAFAAPIFSKEMQGNQPWGTSAYGGVIGMHYFSETFQMLYGGVYQYSFGRHQGYPYFGIMWAPSPKCSVTLTFPWPSITYVPRDRWLLQLGVAPGGSSWVRRGDDFESTESIGSWNLNAGAGYRFHGNLWLYAGAGVAGLRGVQIERGRDRTRFESKPGGVFTLAIQFRP